jgi:hypothetical protein
VGYQVVEIAEELPPTTGAGLRPGRGQEKRQPYSPPVCRAVEVAPETSAAAADAKSSPRRKRRDLIRSAAIAAGGSVLVVFAIALIVDRLPARTPAAPLAVPAAKRPVLAPAPVGAVTDERKAEKETFGTSVEFVRNVAEAGRIASKERKLLLVLHVSGNFEEARFT